MRAWFTITEELIRSLEAASRAQNQRKLCDSPLSALTRCLQEEAAAISAAADRLSSHEVEQALNLLEQCADRKAKLVI